MPGPWPAVHAVADGDTLIVVDVVVVVIILVVVVVELFVVVFVVDVVIRGVVVDTEDETAGVLEEVLEVVLDIAEVLRVELVVEDDFVICVVLEEIEVLTTSELNVV